MTNANDSQLARPWLTLISDSPTARVMLSQEEATPSKSSNMKSSFVFEYFALTLKRYVTLAWKDPQNIVEEINKLK